MRHRGSTLLDFLEDATSELSQRLYLSPRGTHQSRLAHPHPAQEVMCVTEGISIASFPSRNNSLSSLSAGVCCLISSFLPMSNLSTTAGRLELRACLATQPRPSC
jgi:hypothetical protein